MVGMSPLLLRSSNAPAADPANAPAADPVSSDDNEDDEPVAGAEWCAHRDPKRVRTHYLEKISTLYRFKKSLSCTLASGFSLDHTTKPRFAELCKATCETVRW